MRALILFAEPSQRLNRVRWGEGDKVSLTELILVFFLIVLLLLLLLLLLFLCVCSQFPISHEGMWCYRSDWLELCFFVVINPRVLSANKVNFGPFFFCFINFPILLSPPPPRTEVTQLDLETARASLLTADASTKLQASERALAQKKAKVGGGGKNVVLPTANTQPSIWQL